MLDDLLSLTRCHLNAMPTSLYAQDWTVLLRNPAAGLKVIERMAELAWSVVVSQFWPHKGKLFRGVMASSEELQRHVCAGFNYPPSQYQLHLQYMLPPFLPFQWFSCLKGVHFTRGRFFPFEYVRRVLASQGMFDVIQQPILSFLTIPSIKGLIIAGLMMSPPLRILLHSTRRNIPSTTSRCTTILWHVLLNRIVC